MKKTTDIFPIQGRIIFLAGLIISALDSAIHHERFVLDATRIIGFALFVVGLSIYGIARFTLGKNFSEALRIKPDHKLIINGPYRFIRHPVYLGEILYFLSISIIFESLYGFVIMVILIPMLLYRIKIEEKLLISTFGQKYLEYARTTKKLIPYIY